METNSPNGVYYNAETKQCGGFWDSSQMELSGWKKLLWENNENSSFCGQIIDQLILLQSEADDVKDNEYTLCDELWHQVDNSVESLCTRLDYEYLDTPPYQVMEDIEGISASGHLLFPIVAIVIGLIGWTLLKK